jgi:hypothetical protein
MNTQVLENVKVLGEIKAEFHDQRSLKPWQKEFNELLLNIRADKPEIMKHYQLGRLYKTDEHKNVVCNAGFNALCKRLTGVTTYTGTINKMVLGTGVTTASASDTQLLTEAYRNNTASGTDASNIAYLTAYFTEGECNGTYKEFGNVIDGTASANTGQLWTHLAGLNWVKTNLVVLVVSCKYTFASA